MPIPYAELGRRADVDAMVAEAMAVGRRLAFERVVGDARTALRGVDARAADPLRQAALAARTSRRTPARLDRRADDASVTIRARLRARRRARRVGVADRERRRPRSDRRAPRSTHRPDQASISRSAASSRDITTAEATAARPPPSGSRRTSTSTIGEETWTIPASTVRTWIRFAATVDGGYPGPQRSRISAATLEPIAAKVNRSRRRRTHRSSSAGGRSRASSPAERPRARRRGDGEAAPDAPTARAAAGPTAPVEPGR